MSKVMNLSDWEPIVTKYKVMDSSPGTAGSFFEPAEAPWEEIVVQEIEIEHLDTHHFDQEAITELTSLEIGDLVSLSTSFKDGHEYEIEGTSKVKSVHFDEVKKVLKIGCAIGGEWEGDKPEQSDAGRG